MDNICIHCLFLIVTCMHSSAYQEAGIFLYEAANEFCPLPIKYQVHGKFGSSYLMMSSHYKFMIVDSHIHL